MIKSFENKTKNDVIDDITFYPPLHCAEADYFFNKHRNADP